MKIDSLLIPQAQAMDSEAVAEIVRARSYPTSFRFQTGLLKQLV
jgi:hypothetical protein